MTPGPVCPSCGPHLDDVLSRLRAGSGPSAAQWLWAPAAREDAHVVVGDGVVVVHDGGGAVVHAEVADVVELPVPWRSVPALVLGPALALRPDLDRVFAELRRVLRPHGVVTLLLPDGPPLGLRGRRLRAEVRAHWEHRSAVDHPDWLLTAADFAVMGDDRLAVGDPGVVDGRQHVDALCHAALLPPALPDELRTKLAAHPSMRAGRALVRRLVARR